MSSLPVTYYRRPNFPEEHDYEFISSGISDVVPRQGEVIAFGERTFYVKEVAYCLQDFAQVMRIDVFLNEDFPD